MFAHLTEEGRAEAAKRLLALLDQEEVAHYIGAYRDAPPGLRL